MTGTGQDTQNQPRLRTFEWVGPDKAANGARGRPRGQLAESSGSVRLSAGGSSLQVSGGEGCGEPGLGRMPGIRGGAPWGLAGTGLEKHGRPALGGSVT